MFGAFNMQVKRLICEQRVECYGFRSRSRNLLGYPLLLYLRMEQWLRFKPASLPSLAH